jgi:glycosyltransferase involved in cell wall biosynthesis
VHYGLTQLFTLGWRGPSVVTFHGSDLEIQWQRQLSLALLALSGKRAVVVVREDLAERMPARVRATRKVGVVPCGVDALQFRPQDRITARRRLGMPEGAMVLLFPAAPQVGVKNYALFKDVAEHVQGLVGKPIQLLALGGVAPSEATVRFAAADVVVLTSLHEGSPVVVKEALASHRPVVSVPVGDVTRYAGGRLPCAVSSGWDAGELAHLVCEASAVTDDAFESVQVPTVEQEADALISVYGSLL